MYISVIFLDVSTI